MILENADGNSKQSTVYGTGSGSINVAGTTASDDITTKSGFTTLFAPFTDTTSLAGTTLKRTPTKMTLKTSAALYVSINGGPVIILDSTGIVIEDLIINSIKVSSNGGAATVFILLQ
jgi:hypothetical protein